MRVVLDTNVIVSMALAKGGTMQALRRYWHEARFVVIGSSQLFDEVREVLNYPHLSALLTLDARHVVLTELEKLCAMVELQEPFPRFDADEDDSYLLAMLRDAEVDCLVTGDKQLLVLGNFEGIPIINAQHFAELLAS